jgi:hypothetical protein
MLQTLSGIKPRDRIERSSVRLPDPFGACPLTHNLDV